MTRSSRRFWLILLIAAIVAAIALRHFAVTGRRAPSRMRPASLARNLLLVTIDTFRADRVGQGLTPNVDLLASRGLAFTNARTAAPLTLPAHVSLMTGLLPPQHGVRENGTYRFDGSHATLARVLRGAGYRTAAFVAAYVLDRRFGLNDGFDFYDDQIERDPDAVARLDAERRGNVVADRAIDWLRSHAADLVPPFFLWVHFYDPHAPYDPPPEYLAKAHGQSYDGEVAFADAQVGRVLAALNDTGHAADTLIVVAGDHGESLGEHGEATHGMLLFDAAVRMPLVLAGPGIAHRVDEGAVSLVDVAPTVLRLLGQPVPREMTGSNLADDSRQRGADVYSETLYPRTASWSPVYGLVEDRWKLLQSAGTKLFDLKADPSEQHDVAAGHESLARTMSARLASIRDSSTAAPDRRERPSAEVAERLRSLGYVAGSAAPASASAGPDPATVIQAWTTFEEAEKALVVREYPRAISILRGLVDAYPDAAVFESSYATAVHESGDRAAALAAARRAVVRHPRDATAFHALAVAARDARQLDEAARAEQAALALDPADPAVHNGLGLLAVDRKSFPDAVAAFGRAVDLDPTNAQYWTNLGNARRAVGDAAGAEQAYRRALEIDGRAVDAANGIGVLLVQAGRPADAIPWFERALAGSPQFYEARLNLGIACEKAGDRARAEQTYRQVLQAPATFARERDAARKLLAALKQGGR